MSSGTFTLLLVFFVVITVVVLIARSKPVKSYFEASKNISTHPQVSRPGKLALSAADRRRVAAEVVAATDAGGSHWVEGVEIAESYGVSVFDVHDEVMAILEDRDAEEEAKSTRASRETLVPGETAKDLGDGGARVGVRGVSYWIGRSELAGLSDRFFVLVREPANVHDGNAIAVFCHGRKIGYLSVKRAEVYAPLLDTAGVNRLKVARVEGDGLCFRLPSLTVVRKLASKA